MGILKIVIFGFFFSMWAYVANAIVVFEPCSENPNLNLGVANEFETCSRTISDMDYKYRQASGPVFKKLIRDTQRYVNTVHFPAVTDDEKEKYRSIYKAAHTVINHYVQNSAAITGFKSLDFDPNDDQQWQTFYESIKNGVVAGETIDYAQKVELVKPWAEAISYMLYEPYHKELFVKLLLMQAVEADKWQGVPTNVDSLNSLFAIGQSCNSSMNQCERSLICHDEMADVSYPDRAKSEGEQASGPGECQTNFVMYGTCQARKVCGKGRAGEIVSHPNQCEATNISQHTDLGDGTWICEGNSTSESYQAQEWRVIEKDENGAYMCSLLVPENDRIRYEQNERILLAFEYLFADDDQSDPFGHKEKFLDIARQIRMQRVMQKSSADQQLFAIYEQFAEKIAELSTYGQSDGYGYDQEKLTSNDALGLDYLMWIIQIQNIYMQKDQMMMATLQYDDKQVNNQTVEGLRSKINKAIKRIQRTNFSKTACNPFGNFHNSCGQKCHHDKGCSFGKFRFNGSDTTFARNDINSIEQRLRVTRDEPQALDSENPDVLTPSPLPALAIPRFYTYDPGLPRSLRAKMSMKRSSRSNNNSTAGTFRTKSTTRKSTQFALDRNQTLKFFRELRRDFKDYTLVKTSEYTNSTQNMTNSTSAAMGPLNTTLLSKAEIEPTVTSTPEEEVPVIKKNDRGFIDQSTLYTIEDQESFEELQRVVVQSFLAYGASTNSRNQSQGKVSYLKILQQVILELRKFSEKSAQTRAELIECLNAKLGSYQTSSGLNPGTPGLEVGGTSPGGTGIGTTLPGAGDAGGADVGTTNTNQGAIDQTGGNDLVLGNGNGSGGDGSSSTVSTSSSGSGSLFDNGSGSAQGGSANGSTSVSNNSNNSQASSAIAGSQSAFASGSQNGNSDGSEGSSLLNNLEGSDGSGSGSASGASSDLGLANQFNALDGNQNSIAAHNAANAGSGATVGSGVASAISEELVEASEEALSESKARTGSSFTSGNNSPESVNLANFGPRKALNWQDEKVGGEELGDSEFKKSGVYKNSPEGKAIMRASASEKNQVRQDDSIWQRVTKTYVRRAYPVLLLKK